MTAAVRQLHLSSFISSYYMVNFEARVMKLSTNVLGLNIRLFC